MYYSIFLVKLKLVKILFDIWRTFFLEKWCVHCACLLPDIWWNFILSEEFKDFEDTIQPVISGFVD